MLIADFGQLEIPAFPVIHTRFSFLSVQEGVRVVARKYSSALYNSPASYEHKSPLLKQIRNTVFSSKLLELQLSSVNGVGLGKG